MKKNTNNYCVTLNALMRNHIYTKNAPRAFNLQILNHTLVVWSHKIFKEHHIIKELQKKKIHLWEQIVYDSRTKDCMPSLENLWVWKPCLQEGKVDLRKLQEWRILHHLPQSFWGPWAQTPRRKEAAQERLAIRYAGCRASSNFGGLHKMNYY
jgi:hypothetical protein